MDPNPALVQDNICAHFKGAVYSGCEFEGKLGQNEVYLVEALMLDLYFRGRNTRVIWAALTTYRWTFSTSSGHMMSMKYVM